MKIDTRTDFGARVSRRLREDEIGGLTTVKADGMPQPAPVWFLWDGKTLPIYSQPKAQKLRTITTNPKVSLNLDGDGRGGDIVVLTGEARAISDAPPADQVAEYLEKYRDGIRRINMTPKQVAQTYSVAIRTTPVEVTGH